MNEKGKAALARLMGGDPAKGDPEIKDRISRERAIAAGLPVAKVGLEKDIAEAAAWRAAHRRRDERER